MVHERGTKKWTSLMLPEQIQMLEELAAEEERKEKPILDEQMKAEYYIILQEALEFDTSVWIKYYANDDYMIEEGYILSMDGVNGIIYMEAIPIQFDDIIEVHLL